MSGRFCRQFSCVRFSLSGGNQSPDSFDRAPAGGFLVRRPRVFIAGSKGRTVKARAAARRGSLDRLPAFGIFAGVTDGEAGDSGYAEPSKMPCLVQSLILFNPVNIHLKYIVITE